jgi:hypothetical protein
MTQLRFAGAWFICTLLFSLCCSAVLPAQTLHIGAIGVSPVDEIRHFLPLARYLSEVLREAASMT